MHVSSVSQYFQSFFFRLYAVFSSFSILLTLHKINADLHIPLKDFYLFPYSCKIIPMFYFLIQKGITMKSLIKTTCTALLFTGILTGCNSNTTPKQEKSALEKNAMHYGEIVKNEYYRATVENAKFEKIDEERRLTTRVMINNVREDGQTIDLSEIKYFIQDEKTGQKYEGEAHPIGDEHYKNVPHEFSLTTDVVFELKTSPKDLNNMYLYIDSKAAPLTNTYWKLDNLVSK
ncbi:hypothetical protein BTAR23_AR23_02773 [Bacillus thuringiensis serovar israelensis]|nr:hypothetical protein BTAR23_AR23_02773 [Bacillus thuringiensis serovar israelensis]